MEDNQYTHWQAANIKPVRYYRETKTSVEKSAIIARRGKYTSVISCRLLDPTPQYPDTCISISLESGGKSVFCQVNPIEFTALLELLQSWNTIFAEHLPGLEAKSAIYRVAKDKQEKEIAMIQSLMQQQGVDGQDSDPSQIIKMIQIMNQMKGESKDA